jgi:poly(A) polymerase
MDRGWRAPARENERVSLPRRLVPLLGPEAPLSALVDRITAAGHECYLVGGSVRDALIDRPLGDLDLTTDARPDAIEGLLSGWADAIWLQGKRFGTIGARKGDATFEITTFRAEVYAPESRKPEVTFGDDITTDLSRRDFTINAMALQLPQRVLVDPFGGLDDLVATRLRTPLSPEISFGDDPLRMMRAARFASQLGFEPVAEIVQAMRAMRRRLEIVSPERIRNELDKLLVSADPSVGLWLLARTGLADEFLPELTAMELEQDPIHRHKDVLEHTIAVVAKTRPELVVRLAALLHDIGKPKTRGYAAGGVTFHHHEVVGARMARTRMEALRYPGELTERVVKLVELHLRFHTYRMGWTDSAVRRYVRDAGELLDDLNHLTRCDCTTRNQRKAQALERRMDELEARIAELREREELASIRPPLDGNDVMTLLGVGPGPEVGRALAFLLDRRLDDGLVDPDAARQVLLDWAVAQGINPG